MAGLLAVGVGLCLRGPRMDLGLWLDEFHTLHHASAADPAALLEGLREDNHPPLSFLAVAAARALLGEAEWVLRLPSLLAGLATVALGAWLARRLPAGRTRPLAPLIVAASSLHLVASSEARMYTWLALAVALWLLGALRRLEGRGGWALLAGATVLGLHSHYHFVHALVVLVPPLLVLGGRRHLGGSLAALAVGLAAFLPWALWGLVPQLGHDLPPGGSASGLRPLAEGLVHLVFHNASLAGSAKPLFVIAGPLLVVSAFLGWAALASTPGGRPAAVLFGAAAFALPAWAALVAYLVPRAGFHWVYLAPSVLPLALLLAAEAEARGPWAGARRLAVGAYLVLALVLAGLNASAGPREDYRGACAYVADQAGSEDVVLGADWQPPAFPHGAAWSYYGPTGPEAPRSLPVGRGFGVADWTAVEAAPQAFLIGRSLPTDVAVLQGLRQRFAHETVERFGESIFVHRFAR